MSELHVLDRTGDLRVIWDENNTAETEHARATYEKFTGPEHRYGAFKVAADGSKGELIRSFDPSAEKIILAPQPQGG